jgi:hypothetical protein
VKLAGLFRGRTKPAGKNSEPAPVAPVSNYPLYETLTPGAGWTSGETATAALSRLRERYLDLMEGCLLGRIHEDPPQDCASSELLGQAGC